MKKRKVSRLRRLLMAVATVGMWPLCAHATSVLTLNVGGTPMEIVLSEHPVITYKGDALHIKTDDAEIDVPVSEITGGAFDHPIATSVRAVERTDMQVEDGELRFSQLPADGRVEVFSLAGQKLCDVSADTNGRATLRLAGLPKGTCIVKTATQAIKIINK